jgi:hypothetical protein
MALDPVTEIHGKGVAHTQPAAGGFICVGRTDAPPGGADIALASLCFESPVERLVGGRV